jgi:hypothetical protein
VAGERRQKASILRKLFGIEVRRLCRRECMSDRGRCCRKSRKLSCLKNQTKICFPQPPAAGGHVRRPVVAFLWVDVVPHLGVRRTRPRGGKISSTGQEILFRQHRSFATIRHCRSHTICTHRSPAGTRPWSVVPAALPRASSSSPQAPAAAPWPLSAPAPSRPQPCPPAAHPS